MSKKSQARPALQSHVSFWDKRNSGVFYPTDTYRGMRSLGFNIFVALNVAFAFHVIHVGYPTQSGWLPDLSFPVSVERIARDTESYTMDGEFDKKRFDGIFIKYDQDNKAGLNFHDIVNMWIGNRNVFDPIGWVFQVALWTLLWCLIADPETGIMKREMVEKQYDGSIYYELEKRQKSGNKLPWFRGGEFW